jgi:hypothetical protein
MIIERKAFFRIYNPKTTPIYGDIENNPFSNADDPILRI